MPTVNWPQFQDYPFSIDNPPALGRAWNWSRQQFCHLQQSLIELPDEVAFVAVSGSLCRMEAHSGSDLDLLIVLDDRQAAIADSVAQQIYHDIWHRILDYSASDWELKAPKPEGIFSKCASWKAITNPQVRGVVNEDMMNFGHRMQLLADAQPIVQHERFLQLRRDILYWYSEPRATIAFQEDGPFHWLRHDVLRYWHSVAARASWLYPDKPVEFLNVNLKLRSSRLVLITALLTAISTAHASGDTLESVADCLQRELVRTPLERLAGQHGILASTAEHQQTVSELLNAYAHVWTHLAAGMTPEVPQQILDSVKTIARECRQIHTMA